MDIAMSNVIYVKSYGKKEMYKRIKPKTLRVVMKLAANEDINLECSYNTIFDNCSYYPICKVKKNFELINCQNVNLACKICSKIWWKLYGKE